MKRFFIDRARRLARVYEAGDLFPSQRWEEVSETAYEEFRAETEKFSAKALKKMREVK